MAIPVAIAYSPKTQTDGITLIGATVIVIDNTINEGIASFPDASVAAPGVAVMHTTEHFNTEDPADYETITYTERHVASNELRGVTRGVEGTAREWAAGTWIASYTSADAWNEMRGEVVASTTHIAETTTTDDVHGSKTYADSIVRGFKNTIINGHFRINQRAHTSGGTLAAGDYGHDRWKAGTGGCDYTYLAATTGTTVTIPATKELLQIVEGSVLRSGNYTLSWSGTSQGKIGGGAYAASPITASVTGGSDLTITFGAGTVSNVQLEQGSVASSFEHRPLGLELSLCHRYYWQGQLPDRGWGYHYTTGHANSFGGAVSYPVEMRISPTVTIVTTPTYTGCTHTDIIGTQHGFGHRVNVSSAVLYRAFSGVYEADAEL